MPVEIRTLALRPSVFGRRMVSAIRKSKTGKVWKDIAVHQPKAIDRYNKYLNGVDRSDQLIGINNIMRKCLRWWKIDFVLSPL